MCNLHNMRDFTHLSDTQRCMFYTICISLAEYVVFAPSSVTQHLHSVCNFTHFVKFVYCVYFSFYFYTNQACFYTQCVVLHTFFIAWPNISWFTLFCSEIRFFVIYAFFGVNFIIWKFCPCKRNDKYEVCQPTRQHAVSSRLL